ncbi:ATP-binding protein [Candidatus Margulisiibacteriota bacterium]
MKLFSIKTKETAKQDDKPQNKLLGELPIDRLLRNPSIIIVFSITLYMLFYYWVSPTLDGLTTVLALFPVMVTGWLLGLRGGMLASLLSIPLYVILLSFVLGISQMDVFRYAGIGHFVVIIMGLLVSRLRRKSDQLKQEIADRKELENQLRMAKAVLETKVKERTAELELAQKRVNQNYFIQSVISSLLRGSLDPISLDKQLDKALDLVLSAPFFNTDHKGSIYLRNEEDNMLELKTHRGIPESMIKECSRVSIDECLCGVVADHKKHMYVSHDDEQPSPMCKKIPGYSHYCVPIISGTKLLGVVNTYLKSTHEKDELEEEFFTVVANTLASIIERKQAEEEIKKANEYLEEKVNERTTELTMANENLKKEINERKQAEDKRQIAYSELQEAQSQLIQAEKLHVVGGLASGVAHEVKNPLSIILQGVGIIEKRLGSVTDEGIAKTLTFMKNAVSRADTVIKGLLDFSSLTQLDHESVQVNEIIDKSLFLLKHQLVKTHVQVVKEYDENIPDIEVDRNRLEQVFVNLFINAQSAMGEKGGSIKVRTGMIYDDDLKSNKLFIDVEDNGPGIPENIIDKVFDPFFTTRRNEGGTGLGLPIVKNIIEMHDGTIDIKNKKNESGLIISLAFPIPKLKPVKIIHETSEVQETN